MTQACFLHSVWGCLVLHCPGNNNQEPYITELNILESGHGQDYQNFQIKNWATLFNL